MDVLENFNFYKTVELKINLSGSPKNRITYSFYNEKITYRLRAVSMQQV